MIEKGIITEASRACFLACRRRYQFEVMEGIVSSSRRFSRSREMDDCLRDLLAGGALLRQRGGDPLEGVEQVLSWWIEGVAGEDEEAQEAYTLAAQIAANYFARFQSDQIVACENGEPVIARGVNLPVAVPCASCVGRGCDRCSNLRDPGWRRSAGWSYPLTLELAIENKRGVWAVIRRMTSDSEPSKVTDSLRLRFNDHGRVWALSRLLGREVRGIIYEVIRRATPREPATTQCRACKGRGFVPSRKEKSDPVGHIQCEACAATGVGGISKAACDTDLDTWWSVAKFFPHLERAELEVEHAEQLNRIRAKGPTFLYRYAVPVSQGDIATWRRELYDTCKDMEHAERDERWTRNPGACNAPGRPCPFRSLCAHGGGVYNGNFVRMPHPPCLEPWRPVFAFQTIAKRREQ